MHILKIFDGLQVHEDNRFYKQIDSMLSYLNAVKKYGNGFLLPRSQTNFR